jgi:hypothetical protein
MRRDMRLTLAIALLAGTMLASTGAALADGPPIAKTTPAGQPVEVRKEATFVSKGTCEGKIPTIDFSPAPAHGKIDIRPARVFISAGSSATHRDCEGREIDGGAIWYIPAAGFHGVDTFSYTVNYGRTGKGERIDTRTAQITVQ